MKPESRVWPLISLWCLLAGCGRNEPVVGHSAATITAMNQGVSLMGQYQYEAAAKAFEEVVRTEPTLADAKVNLAIARFNQARKQDHNLQSAGALLEEVLKDDPNNVRALYFKGIVLQHIGQADAAVTCFEKVAQQRPEDGVNWYLLGMCKQRLGQPCERELLKAIELRPYLGSAYYKLWQVFQAEEQTEKAKPYMDKFQQLRESPLNELIELPQYNQMGELALVRPLPPQNAPPITKAVYSFKPSLRVLETGDRLLNGVRPASPGTADNPQPFAFGGAAIADLNHDGLPDVILTSQGADGAGRLVLLRGQPNGKFVDSTAGSGLELVRGPLSCALGDFDNDENVDLFVVSTSGNRLFRGKGDGTFVDITSQAAIGGEPANSRSALFLDADHDGDLDIFVCNAGSSGNQLWNNNADGTFTNIASAAGVDCAGSTCVMALAGDLDGDRDTDLVILREGQPARVFLNDLTGKYHEVNLGDVKIEGDLGGVLQDFNGDGNLDVLVLGGNPTKLRLFLGDGHGHFQPDPAFAQTADAAASWGPLRGFRVADLDLDGDLDIIAFSTEAHLLLNDGAGRFVLQPQLWKAQGSGELAGAEVVDLNGDRVSDLLCIERGAKSQVLLVPGALTPPSTALSITPTGMRGRDKRTRSPATGYGVTMTVRAGLRQQTRVLSGQTGSFNQSPLPSILGLGGARQADYVRFLWPDGVAQVEIGLAAGQLHPIAELQRKLSSCPVLFAWNGTRFGFVTDFAGVGGLGYFIAPGQYAQPQPLEHVKIESSQLHARNGAYELRIAEPMEEVAYLDQLELLAIDHPADLQVFPDERLAVTGPLPTHQLLVVNKPIFPERAWTQQAGDCTEQLARVDRVYAYQPELDRRFFGFAQPHTLELDFGSRLADVAAEVRLFLFINGYLEYPYSQTAYAASQARVGWEPIRIERLMPDGRWQTIVADAGAFGGMARMMTVDMTGLLAGPRCRLRLTSNLEIYYDQLFVARDVGQAQVNIHPLPLSEAELRHVGFAREFSPDGRLPLLYDYDLCDTTAPFHCLRGDYTRYGPVRELLESFDDEYVLVGPGDELAVTFDASRLPEPPEGIVRSFVLVSHAYCKDMDLYTATPQTLEPLPFRAMSRYPYPATEHYPDDERHRRFRQTYNTRVIE